MTNPLHAHYYADGACSTTALIVENIQVATGTFRLRLACPEIARQTVPGQFLMFRLAGCNDPLIGRPLALYDTFENEQGETAGMDVVYLVGGKFTTRLSTCGPGTEIGLWGPLGNGFTPSTAQHLIMVAGGIGHTPFLALGQEALGAKRYGAADRNILRPEKVTLCYGARSGDMLAGVSNFQAAGIDVQLCTDDGSRGHHGLVTDLLKQTLDNSDLSCQVSCCGPEPMMEAVANVASQRDVPCEVSLETPMACGIGICFSCVAKVRDESGEWDYKRTCVEGPIFDAASIDW
jgi:dihydroorotate dehydrogenase electron transfer subunit